jgi:hypothetical protein
MNGSLLAAADGDCQLGESLGGGVERASLGNRYPKRL